MSTWCWVISPFNDFAFFWVIAVNTVDNLQFLIFIYAVLLPYLCSVSLCNSRKNLSSFWILKIKTLTLHQVQRTNMHHHAKFHHDHWNVAKFDLIQCSSFSNMKRSIFCPFGLKTPIHASQIGILGDFTPYVGSSMNETPKRHILVWVCVA